MKSAFRLLYDTAWFHWSLVGPVLILRYIRIVGRLPRLLRPVSMNEKVLLRLMFDRRPFLPVFAGKYESRAYVAETTGDPSLLVNLVGLASTTAELKALSLPPRFIVKANHMSGRTRIYDGSRPLDLDELGRTIEGWCSDFGKLEWAYKDTSRVAVIEHLLDQDGAIPTDYKFFCYDGRVRFIQVDGSRFTGHRRDYFDRDWNWIDTVVSYPNHEVRPERPALLERMIAVSEKLSQDVDFVRVDLYAIGDRIKFGELTNYPGGSKEPFDKQHWDDEFGRPWTISRRTPPRLAHVRVPPDAYVGKVQAAT